MPRTNRRDAVPLEPVSVCLANVQPQEVDWLWPGRIASKRITVLIGRPGDGKSFLTLDIAARITRGSVWPDGSSCQSGSVILISAEDDAGDTIRPRFDALNGDVDRIHLLTGTCDAYDMHASNLQPFTLANLTPLETMLKRISDCRLVVIDPLNSFVGGDVDIHRDNQVRSVLSPLARLAATYGPAVLLVLHRRKGTDVFADNLALGSVAFTGIARSALHLTLDHKNRNFSRRLLLPGKCNIAAKASGLAFTISGKPATIVWEAEPVDMTADDALAAENASNRCDRPGPKPTAKNAAGEWLKKLLGDGPMKCADIEAAAEDAGHTWRTVTRAKETLGIESRRGKFGGEAHWYLPEPLATVSSGSA